MLEAGADVNATMTVGDLTTAGTGGSVGDATALNLAAVEGHLEVVKLLIAHGADVNAPEAFYNRTALHGAAWFNHHEIVQMLIENGADLNPHSTWADGETPLHFAARNGSAEAIQVLIDADADLDVQTEVGGTPLINMLRKVARYNPEIISLLLTGGANPNLQDVDGNTALHYASNYRRAEAISILIEHGAALDLVNNNSETALDVAATEVIAELLRAAGAEE
jgi:ankyrin repeat protein